MRKQYAIIFPIFSSKYVQVDSIALITKTCLKHFQQKIDVNEWLVFPQGKTQFPLYVQNHGRASLNDTTRMHVLIEADAEIYYPQAYAKATRVIFHSVGGLT